MSGFSADWLALREPYDLSARNREVLDAVLAAFADYASVSIADLACGTGSTVRALAPRLPVRQTWRLVDNDLSLLARAAGTAVRADVQVTAVPVDLNRDLEAALDGPIDLVTTSALLDLVSAEWLERLAVETAVRSIPLYAALSYDGRIVFDPVDDADADIVAAVNAHQRTDKGFGPALGPAAAQAVIARFESLGYRVTHGTSDWVFGPDDRDIQLETCAGWAGAARETGRLSLEAVASWLTRRRDAITARRSSIRVGHVDLFARPMGTR
jgi:SAM-dependent methyltransferase